MTTYRRKSTQTIEATQFTSELGELLREGGEHPGLTYSEHSGYDYHGARITFGDYMVGRSVIARETFEGDWEPVIEARFQLPSTPLGDALRDTDAVASAIERGIAKGRARRAAEPSE